MVDTIIYENGLPNLWLFTSKDGTIMKKRIDKLNPNEIIKKFSDIYSPSNGAPMALFRKYDHCYIKYELSSQLKFQTLVYGLSQGAYLPIFSVQV